MTEDYFQRFRLNTIGYNAHIESRFGKQPLIYADWTASGRLYGPIEDIMRHELGPFVANTHTETSSTGTFMTHAYHSAQALIKQHVNAGEEDVIVTAGFGMTAVVNKFQRILGLRIPEKFKGQIQIPENEKPLVIITHMEHHSNQTSWLECCCDVKLIQYDRKSGLPDLNHLEDILNRYQNRQVKIGAFTACSNVTGVITPYQEMAKIMHRHGGVAFIDFAASAPYVTINMHPENPEEYLDAILFSPHKFLGGPGSSGILIFNKKLYTNRIPDHPGGGTVLWTNPWGEHRYVESIEAREDGGTPGFLQCIRAALAIRLKEEMNPTEILKREHQLMDILFNKLDKQNEIFILERHNRNRTGILSLYLKNKHYNLVVKLLNDKYGIQSRGGCSCAGTYGHLLLDVNYEMSHAITCKIDEGDLSEKPGWVRISVHPTMTNDEVNQIADAILEINNEYELLKKYYCFDSHNGEFYACDFKDRFYDFNQVKFL